jgi:DNA-binding cell septation regulator SpoVG
MEQQKKFGTKKELVKHSFTVERVHVFEDGSVTFNMVIDGYVRVYGLRIYDGRDGKPFISFPSRKGKDDKYWNHVYCPLSPEDVENIARQVEEQMA